MTGLKLYYFDLPGIAEQIRLTFRMGNIPFEDIRISMESWMTEHKAKAPAGTVPYLVLDNGSVLCESGAILMYAAARAGLIPTDPVHGAYAQQALDLLASLTPIMRRFYMEPNNKEEICAAMKARCVLIDKVIGKTLSADGYVAGNRLSYADISVYSWTKKTLPFLQHDLGREVLRECPALRRVTELVEKEPKIQAYYS
uniref:Glutathione S-transferase n=1 Tax=Phaedon brassicae TaxID=154011 RepID=A0A9Y1PSW2_9CUCU|nr:glutathione S-transferase [Phaedon brassicae]